MRRTFSLRNLKRIWARSEGATLITDLLAQADPKASLFERVLWLEHVLRWLKGRSDSDENQKVRLRYLFQTLDKNPQWKSKVAALIRTLLRDSSFLRLFLQTGFAIESGLWTELVNRVLTRFLPEPPENDFFEIVVHSLRDEEDGEWIAGLSAEMLRPVLELIMYEKSEQETPGANPALAMREALLVLATNLAHYGLSSEVRRRQHLSAVESSPFLLLLGAVQILADPENGTQPDLNPLLGGCRQALAAVYKDMESSGVSVALVYRLEVMSALLDRIELIRDLMTAAEEKVFLETARSLFAASVTAAAQRRSISEHLREHLYLLSRKVVERNGYSGEHYSFRRRSEFWYLFLSGIGGGFIVVLMTVGKILLHDLHPPALIYATGAWIIYAVGFLAMQFSGATLATKLPSFVASHLANQLRDIRERGQLSAFTTEFRASTLSQAMAFLGNVCGLVPLGILLIWGFTSLGIYILSPGEAGASLFDLHPYYSMAIPLGALTGVELWLSSLAGGWFENWIVFRRLPEALRYHPLLNRVMGEKSSTRISEWLLANSSGIAANITLGFLFGFVPFWGAVLGLNLESKHVTISSTTAVLSFASLPTSSLELWGVLEIVISLLCIGAMNFLVSFICALIVAARASNVKRAWLLYALGLTRKHKTDDTPAP